MPRSTIPVSWPRSRHITATFGKKFDELFIKALGEIKNFGQALEEMGGTILTTVDGVEVTVEHVAAIEEQQLLQADYGSTLREIPPRVEAEERARPAFTDSQVAADSRRGRHRAPSGRIRRLGRQAGSRRRSQGARRTSRVSSRSAITAQQLSAEEGKLRRVEESIRVFVRVADPKYRQVVPMRFFNLTLSTPEADAYSASYTRRKESSGGRRPNTDSDDLDFGTHRNRTRGTQTQPEDVILVEVARGCSGTCPSGYGQHLHGGCRHRCPGSRAKWCGSGGKNNPRIRAEAAQPSRYRGQSTRQRQLELSSNPLLADPC